MKNIKSEDPKIIGHSIKNIHIKHMLMHEDKKVRYVCISGHPTPEKSTWKLDEVTCKNCLHKLKTILHKKDWRGKRKAIYNGQLYDEILDETTLYIDASEDEDWELTTFCTECFINDGDSLCLGLGDCPYRKLITKMNNGMHDCPDCGGESKFFKVLPYFVNLEALFPLYYTLMKCKVCGRIWQR